MDITMNKNHLISRLQTQINNLTQDLEILQICQRNLIFEKDLSENSKSKLNLLLDNIIRRIQDEIEEYNDLNNIVCSEKNLNEELITKLDLMNIRYSKLALQIEKIIVSTPTFIELRNQASSNIKSPAILTKSPTFHTNTQSILTDGNKSLIEDSSIDKLIDKPMVSDNLIANKSFSNIDENKGFMKDTFNTKLNKNLSIKKIESLENKHSNLNPTKRPLSSSAKKEPRKNFIEEINSEWIDTLMKQFAQEYEVIDQGYSKGQSKSISFSNKDIKIPPSLPNNNNNKTQDRKKSGFDLSPTIDFIKREMMDLKSLYLDIKDQLEKHTHPEFETEIQKIKFELNKMVSQNKIIQKDNSELMHTVYEIKKEMKELKKENQELRKELKKLRKNQISFRTENDENIPNNHNNQKNISHASPHFSEKLTQQRESSKEGLNKQTSKNRFLISKDSKNVPEDELASSWVRQRINK